MHLYCLKKERKIEPEFKKLTNILKNSRTYMNNCCKYIIEVLFNRNTVKLGNKERFDKEQIGIKELFMDYQPFYTINLLLDKELLPI